MGKQRTVPSAPSSAMSGMEACKKAAVRLPKQLKAAPVSQPRNNPGIYRGFNVAHADAWHTGYAVGKHSAREVIAHEDHQPSGEPRTHSL